MATTARKRAGFQAEGAPAPDAVPPTSPAPPARVPAQKKGKGEVYALGVVCVFAAVVVVVMSPCELSFSLARLHVKADLEQAVGLLSDPVRLYRFSNLVSDVEMRSSGVTDGSGTTVNSFSYVPVQHTQNLWSQPGNGRPLDASLTLNKADILEQGHGVVTVQESSMQPSRKAVLELRIERAGMHDCDLEVHVVALPSIWFWSGQHKREITQSHSAWLERALRSLESKNGQ
mmetsp:Transcript_37178/g.96473  ORF Transcript_37178/g.96473 Transcript_37178/m.96473 type:complete len:231 (-) Transcript_37178:151-843(-)|eukprot:jgi/Tetstr1/422836/TSEL_013627.t1